MREHEVVSERICLNKVETIVKNNKFINKAVFLVFSAAVLFLVS